MSTPSRRRSSHGCWSVRVEVADSVPSVTRTGHAVEGGLRARSGDSGLRARVGVRVPFVHGRGLLMLLTLRNSLLHHLVANTLAEVSSLTLPRVNCGDEATRANRLLLRVAARQVEERRSRYPCNVLLLPCRQVACEILLPEHTSCTARMRPRRQITRVLMRNLGPVTRLGSHCRVGRRAVVVGRWNDWHLLGVAPAVDKLFRGNRSVRRGFGSTHGQARLP